MSDRTERIRLVRPAPERRDAFFEMAREFGSEGDERYGPALADFAAYLARCETFAAGADLDVDEVRMDVWWLVDGERVLGGGRLRHFLIPVLELDGGHIGYDIRPSQRGRGYGHLILERMLEKAASAGLSRVLITCETTNRASARVIERAGGAPISRSISPGTGREMLRYWIELA